MRYGVLALTLLLAAPAQAAGDAAAGRRVADAWCVGCHIVGDENKAPMLDVPPFPDVAKQRSADQIRTFLAKPHPAQPLFRLTPKDVDDLAAFIAGLRK
jgi:mono/diheme cytochrome c family protein